MNAGTEMIVVNGKPVVTLKELLRPGLRAVFIGFNPSPTSVAAGHYYKGQHGSRRWTQLQKYGVMSRLPKGAEDVAAYNQGFGFADLVRRPTGSADKLKDAELNAGVQDLVLRLEKVGDRPILVFIYKKPWERAAPTLAQKGFLVLRMPSPYERAERAETLMRELVSAIEVSRRSN